MTPNPNLPRDYNFGDTLAVRPVTYSCGCCGRSTTRTKPPKRPDFCSHRCARKGQR